MRREAAAPAVEKIGEIVRGDRDAAAKAHDRQLAGRDKGPQGRPAEGQKGNSLFDRVSCLRETVLGGRQRLTRDALVEGLG